MTKKLTRREALGLLLGTAFVAVAGLLPSFARGAAPRIFAHGVASGDPLHDRVILWTRVSGVQRRTRVHWMLARDPGMRDVIRQGRTYSEAKNDFTVKVDADRLPAGATLYYQFRVGNERSPIGRTKTTAIKGVDPVTLGVVSCANYAYGYFNVYREVAQQDDLDAVLHLGDYIYEHGPGGYATEYSEMLGRVPVPPKEITTLADYRARYAQYRLDDDLAAAHRQHAFIVVWDDHEFTNDSWKGGAENHQNDEGEWHERRDAAIQAYLEWMPIRAQANAADTRIFRSFQFGDLASLIMLDTRLHGRDQQADAIPGSTVEEIAARLRDPSRRMLGAVQEAWLATELDKAASSQWQIIGQQLMMMSARAPDLEPLIDRSKPSLVSGDTLERYVQSSKGQPPLILDTWNGYPVAREEMLGLLAARADNPVVLSGDLHTPLAGNLVPMGQDTPVAVELFTGSVTSPGFADYLPEKYPGAFRDALITVNPNIKYAETAKSGWLKVSVSESECVAEWHLVDTVQSRDYTSSIEKRLRVVAGKIEEGLQPGEEKSAIA